MNNTNSEFDRVATKIIERRIQQGKSSNCDWFKDNANLNRIALTLSALANSSGGTVLIGVGPTGIVEGVRDTTAAIDHVIEAALALDPALIIPIPTTVAINNCELVVVNIPDGMPNVYSLDGRYLHRDGANNIGLKPNQLRRLILERGVTSFEAEVALNTTLDDIDWEKAKSYASTISRSDEQQVEKILERRGCLTRFHGELLPSNAGILLFGKDPQRYIRGTQVTAARFAGNTMGDTFSREDITGTLPDQIRRAETFLVDRLRRGVTLGSTMERIENLEYPLEAARELVVNAVAHRDYSIAGDDIRLFLFRDRMEVSSPGGLAGPVTVQNIKDERFSRNPIIVQVLADMGFIERLGYGVDRVIDLMMAQNLPEPIFEETAGSFRATLHGAEELEPSARSSANLLINLIDVPLNPRQEVALKHLQQSDNSRITNSDLQLLCPDVHAETIRRDLADLVTKNILVKMGIKRGSYYVLNPDWDPSQS